MQYRNLYGPHEMKKEALRPAKEDLSIIEVAICGA